MAVVAIYEATAKKLEFASGKSGMATLFEVISGKHGFYNGEKYKHFEIPFLPDIFIKIDPQYSKRCRIAKFGGGVFL